MKIQENTKERQEEVEKNHEKLNSAREKFSPFLKNNPGSKISYDSERNILSIEKPWSDSSIKMILPDDFYDISDEMNCIILPERFTAIYHVEHKSIEFIYTAFPIEGNGECIKKRSFSFSLNGKVHNCSYKRSSSVLLHIARYTKPVSQSLTDYRNLQSYYLYCLHQDFNEGKKEKAPTVPIGEPISFWVDNIEWDDNQILSLVRNLNFMMTYYDILSPNILIHTPAPEQTISQPRPRFRLDSFPSIIQAKELDENILAFWNASRTGDPIQRFLFSYRIIEYISFTYLDASARQEIQVAMSAPHALFDIKTTSDLVISAIQGCKLSDVQKFEAVIKDLVDPYVLWKEIECDKKAFSSNIKFDGGMAIEKIINIDWEFSDFITNGMVKFCKQIRDIRNALSHGRDQKTTMVIAPTIKNFSLLRPWGALISAAAEDVIVKYTSLS